MDLLWIRKNKVSGRNCTVYPFQRNAATLKQDMSSELLQLLSIHQLQISTELGLEQPSKRRQDSSSREIRRHVSVLSQDRDLRENCASN